MGSSKDFILTIFPPAKISMFSSVIVDSPFKSKFFLHQKYVVEGLSCGEIAAQIFSARTTVLKYLKLHGIPVRESGSNQRRKRGLGYGQKVQCRQLENHQREQENIKKMRELRETRDLAIGRLLRFLIRLKFQLKPGRGSGMRRPYIRF